MKKLIAITASTLTALSLSACNFDSDSNNNDDNDVNNSPMANAMVRVTHASSDAPLVMVALNDEVVTGLEMVDYQQGSGLISVPSGNYSVAVDALLPGNTSAEVIAADLSLSANMQYDVVALNFATSIEPVVLSRTAETVASDMVRLDVLHAHPNVPGVDIYLTTEASIDNEAPAISNLEFKVDSMDLPVTVPAGTYRIRITVNGDKTAVFDSGDLDLSGGSDLLITAVPNTNGGSVSPVNLLLGSGDGTGVLRSAGEQATVRVVHGVDDAPEVDVLASGAPVTGFTSLPFKGFASLDLPAATYDLSVAASADNSLVVINAPGTTLAAGSTTSIYAIGKLNSVTDETIDPLVISEDLRPVASYAKVRVVHASPTANSLGTVEIHASADGNFSAETAVLTGISLNDNAVLEVPGGTYNFAVILSTDTTYMPAINTQATIGNGGVYSVMATDDFSDLVLNVDVAPEN